MKCWSKPKYRKIIYHFIDALRFDSAFENKQESGFNCMKNMQTLGNEKNTQRYLFKAHGPTTTVQRLNALFTGTIPAFVDISNSFRSSETKFDSVFRQIYNNN